MSTTSTDPAVRQPVWDLPTRLFHWLLVGLIAFSWWSAENDELDLHIWAGMAVLSLLIFRLLWGLFGSSTARFTNFVRGPRAVLGYLKDASSWRSAGHTPLGALSVLALLGLIAAEVALGLVAADEDGFFAGPLAHLVSISASEAATDLHEDLFNVLLALIGLHLAAILYYRLRGKRLVGAMVTGKGALPPGATAMRPSRWWAALLCLAAAIAVTRWVIAGAPPL
jgi:cytochrome b